MSQGGYRVCDLGGVTENRAELCGGLRLDHRPEGAEATKKPQHLRALRCLNHWPILLKGVRRDWYEVHGNLTLSKRPIFQSVKLVGAVAIEIASTFTGPESSRRSTAALLPIGVKWCQISTGGQFPSSRQPFP